MEQMTFRSQISIGSTFDNGFSQADVKCEPMLFDCDVQHAMQLGGPITRAFLAVLPADWLNEPAIFDSRVHMLMEGWYPCIPGFHHDDVPRGGDGQPNYRSPEYRAEHVMGLVNGAICPTVFALGDAAMPLDVGAQPIYRRWHAEVERLLYEGLLRPQLAPSGRAIFFDCNTFHSGTKATVAGWRWFGRLSRNTARTKAPKNEVRQQVQVYLDNSTEGW